MRWSRTMPTTSGLWLVRSKPTDTPRTFSGNPSTHPWVDSDLEFAGPLEIAEPLDEAEEAWKLYSSHPLTWVANKRDFIAGFKAARERTTTPASAVRTEREDK